MKFVPKNAGMTKKDVVQWMNDEIEMLTNEVECCIDEEADYRPENAWAVGITVKSNKLSNKLAQEFVDFEYQCMTDAADMCEEEMVEMRTEGIFKIIKKYAKAIK